MSLSLQETDNQIPEQPRNADYTNRGQSLYLRVQVIAWLCTGVSLCLTSAHLKRISWTTGHLMMLVRKFGTTP